jgi:hypothetical protein
MIEMMLIKENARRVLNTVRRKHTDMNVEEQHEEVMSILLSTHSMDDEMLEEIDSYVGELISNCSSSKPKPNGKK